MTPVTDPITRTCASGTGVSDEASVTRPVMTPVLCAAATEVTTSSHARDATVRRRTAAIVEFDETRCANMQPASKVAGACEERVERATRRDGAAVPCRRGER